jgi:hypothetical protein
MANAPKTVGVTAARSRATWYPSVTAARSRATWYPSHAPRRCSRVRARGTHRKEQQSQPGYAGPARMGRTSRAGSDGYGDGGGRGQKLIERRLPLHAQRLPSEASRPSASHGRIATVDSLTTLALAATVATDCGCASVALSECIRSECSASPQAARRGAASRRSVRIRRAIEPRCAHTQRCLAKHAHAVSCTKAEGHAINASRSRSRSVSGPWRVFA